ncbi:MAG: MAPEG family protein [Polyangiaceae bacterium]|nr:MAPEG family protein [Polyangiaceae bacterium]
MTIPFICVLIAFVLIYVPRVFVATAQAKQPEGLDNRNPRAQQAKLTGLGARAQAAHLNSFESFAPFAAAVVIAHLAGADATWSAILASVHVGARALYIGAYLGDIPTARSLIWMIGLLSTLGLFLLKWFA